MKSLLYVLITLLLTSITNQATADEKPLTGQARIDSLEAELPKAKADTNHVKLLLGLCASYQYINADKGIEYAEKALEISTKLNWMNGLVMSYHNLGLNREIKGDYDMALNYYNEGLKINIKNGNELSEAGILLNIGTVYAQLGDYPNAFEHYNKALIIYKKLDDKKGLARTTTNIGIVYYSKSDYAKSMEYFYRALTIHEKIGNKTGMVNTLNNLGSISINLGDYGKAQENYESALEIFKELDNKYGLSLTLGNLGMVHNELSNYKKAIEYYEKAIKINIDLENKKGLKNNYMNLAGLYQKQKDYIKSLEYNYRSLEIAKGFKERAYEAQIYGNIGLVYLLITRDNINLNQKELSKYVSLNRDINLNKGIEYTLSGIRIYEEIGEKKIRSELLGNLADAYKLKGNYKKWGETLVEYHILKDSVFNQENNKQIAAIEKAREDDVNRIKIEKQEVQLAAQEKEKSFIIYSAAGGILSILIILGVIFNQRRKSDKLLYNVLPVSIAKRLKKKEHPISDYFTQASIIFIDIVSFTSLSRDADPRNIVVELNKIFTKFDTIAKKYGLEKIKTIGDSYMAAAGIPEVQKDNTHRAAQMALEVKAIMSEYYTADGTKIEVRIGLDCGPVVAGVIGENKFIYDMWSDAVNTASRMETTSEAGKVHITERFKEAVTEYEQFDYIERGEIEIKGKGKMKTYFIEERKVESRK